MILITQVEGVSLSMCNPFGQKQGSDVSQWRKTDQEIKKSWRDQSRGELFAKERFIFHPCNEPFMTRNTYIIVYLMGIHLIRHLKDIQCIMILMIITAWKRDFLSQRYTNVRMYIESIIGHVSRCSFPYWLQERSISKAVFDVTVGVQNPQSTIWVQLSIIWDFTSLSPSLCLFC